MAAVIERITEDIVMLTDNKFDDPVHPDFVGPSPSQYYTLGGWIDIIALARKMDVGMGGLRPGKRVEFAQVVVEREAVDEFVWHKKSDEGELRFSLPEQEALLFAIHDRRIAPVEMTQGELWIGSRVVCVPMTKELIDMEGLLEE